MKSTLFVLSVVAATVIGANTGRVGQGEVRVIRPITGMRVQILSAAFLLASVAGPDANQLLSMAVSPAQSFAPTNLTIRLRVEPDTANRALEVIAESGDYYRSSKIQLDGSEAPGTVSVEFRNVPGGEYEVRATLIGNAGKARAAVRQQVIVMDSGRMARAASRNICGLA